MDKLIIVKAGYVPRDRSLKEKKRKETKRKAQIRRVCLCERFCFVGILRPLCEILGADLPPDRSLKEDKIT